jgi:hypothetical protein
VIQWLQAGLCWESSEESMPHHISLEPSYPIPGFSGGQGCLPDNRIK